MIYLTRDKNWKGVVWATVDVWEEKPVRHPHDDDQGVEWLNADGYSINGHINFIPLKDCMDRYGTVPDDDNMMIKVGT